MCHIIFSHCNTVCVCACVYTLAEILALRTTTTTIHRNMLKYAEKHGRQAHEQTERAREECRRRGRDSTVSAFGWEIFRKKTSKIALLYEVLYTAWIVPVVYVCCCVHLVMESECIVFLHLFYFVSAVWRIDFSRKKATIAPRTHPEIYPL